MVVKCSRREPEKLGMPPLSGAVASADNAGQNDEAWANDTASSLAVAEPTAVAFDSFSKQGSVET